MRRRKASPDVEVELETDEEREVLESIAEEMEDVVAISREEIEEEKARWLEKPLLKLKWILDEIFRGRIWFTIIYAKEEGEKE